MKKFLMVLLSIAFVLNLTIVIGLIGGYGSPRRALYTITDELMNSAYRFKRGTTPRSRDHAESGRPHARTQRNRISQDRKSTRLNSSHIQKSRMPSSA